MYTQRQVEKLLLKYDLACKLKEDTKILFIELKEVAKATSSLLSKALTTVSCGNSLK